MKHTPRTPILIAFALLVAAAGCEGSTKNKTKAADKVPTKSETRARIEHALDDKAPVMATTSPAVQGAEKLNNQDELKPETGDVIDDANATPIKSTDALEGMVYEPSLMEGGNIKLRRLATAPAIENREPVAAGSVFDHHGDPVYAFMDVSNKDDIERELTVNFIGPNGEVRGGVAVTVPANVPRWRTWAFTKHADKEGTWTVEVRNEETELLGSIKFDVEPGC